MIRSGVVVSHVAFLNPELNGASERKVTAYDDLAVKSRFDKRSLRVERVVGIAGEFQIQRKSGSLLAKTDFVVVEIDRRELNVGVSQERFLSAQTFQSAQR